MDDYVKDLIEQAKDNTFFRQVLDTGDEMQIVIMSLKPGEEIGLETHENNEQVLICINGNGRYVVDGDEQEYNSGDMVLVRKGQEHNFLNDGPDEMKIITIYSPPHHADGTVHKTKADASNEHFAD